MLAEAAVSAPVFAALGDPTRLGVVRRLTEGPASITRLTDGTAMTRQAVTKHLTVLEKAGLVRHLRQGRETLWELERRKLEEARDYLDLMSRQWDERLSRLRGFVED